MRLREEPRQLPARVEMDDVYLGGQVPGGKPGRGSENKVSFVTAVQTTQDGQAAMACFAQLAFTKTAMADFMAKSLVRPHTVVSDGLACFTATEDVGVHQPTVTGGGETSVKLPQFKAVNTVLSNLKTSLSGSLHAFRFAKYTHRYLADIQYRFNRRFDLKIILHRFVGAAIATTPRPARILRIGLTEVCR